MDSLNDNNVYHLQKGRILGENTGGTVKDVILVGLHSLTEGEKTPLTEYNKTIQQLQCRSGIMSVTKQAKDCLQPLPQPMTTTAPRSTTPPIESPTAILAGNDLQDSGDMLVEESTGDKELTEIDRILNDLADGVPELRLLRLNEEDVALDMVKVVMDDKGEESQASDDDDSEESSV